LKGEKADITSDEKRHEHDEIKFESSEHTFAIMRSGSLNGC
jgi:hypothetical protein